MRTSLNNTKAIDDYLTGLLAPEDAFVFEASLLLNKDLANDMLHQQNTYAIIRQYRRLKLKEEIVSAQKLFVDAPAHQGIMQRILQLFKKE